MKKLIVFFSVAIVFISCQTNDKKSFEINQIFEDYYQESLELYPLNATSQGDNRYNDFLPNDLTDDFRNDLVNTIKEYYEAYEVDEDVSVVYPINITDNDGELITIDSDERLEETYKNCYGQERDWYKNNLGLVTNEYGSLFEFRSSDDKDNKGYLQWSPFDAATEYFKPSEKEFMINYRVENIEALVMSWIKP